MDEHPRSVVFLGVTYTRNPDAEQRANRVYYAAPRDSGRGLLHRDIWEHHHGRPIPDGHHIHHDDGDPFNNEPGNLVCLTPAEHAAEHAEKFRDQRREHADRIRPLTVGWHRSEEGREWHRQHGAKVWEGREPVTLTCAECGKEFASLVAPVGGRGGPRYCSRPCVNRASHRSHRYDVQVPCPICGTLFWRRKTKDRPRACSLACGQRYRRVLAG